MKFNKPLVFTGSGVAVITPMKRGGVDFEALGKLIDWQIEQGTDAIVAVGTTGEASTLTDEEHRAVIKFTVEHTAGRVPVVAGTGANDTDYEISLSRYACEVGADALLLVTPYYNKTSPKGLVKHFFAAADATDKPIILYNVPSRTGLNITVPTYKELSKHERIVAVKEASGSISQIAQIGAACGGDLAIYSGNDDQITPIMSLGGMGVISVLANVMPCETHLLAKYALDGNFAESARLQLELLDLVDALFVEVNPIPVKAAMALLGWCEPEIRLPLCEMEDKNHAMLVAALKKHGLLAQK
jgi:dihydrodipicolinate synthase